MIYILHFEPPYRHAGHYVGFTESPDVAPRVAEHIEGKGRRPSPLVRAAIQAGSKVLLAGVIDGDRELERRLKKRKNARSFCPLCKAAYNQSSANRMRQRRANIL